MDTAYDLPFTFQVITEYDDPYIQLGINFYQDDLNLLNRNITASIEENDNVSILFNSDYSDARLYLEALDILPAEYDVEVDDDGCSYRCPNNASFPLYRQGDDFDALRVDKFKILVSCNEAKYYGILEVKPKQLNQGEWQIMKDDLEHEITGLAQDIVRRNIGIGNENQGNQPPEKLQKFLTIRKHANAVLNALIDIKDKPKFEIKKRYVREESYKAKELDSESIKRSLKNPHLQNQLFVPFKFVSYDIQENKLLKHILQLYEKELKSFVCMIENMIEHYEQNISKEIYPNYQYNKAYKLGLSEFLRSAQKLIKITNIVKTQPWFKEISDLKTGIVPHSFALDSRYGAIYKMYRELLNDKFSIELDPQYSYSWKKSSELYEMWCYIKICHSLSSYYDEESDLFAETFSENYLFPFLKKGTKMVFSNTEIKIDIIYDEILPKKKEQSENGIQPLYMIGHHIRPDIILNIYYKPQNMYVGSIILESKYRKIKNFWYGSTQSSKEQIQEYYEDARSTYFYNDVSKRFDVRPVLKVIVLTPDETGNNKRAKENRILIKTLRPNDNQSINEILDVIQTEIGERLSVAKSQEN